MGAPAGPGGGRRPVVPRGAPDAVLPDQTDVLPAWPLDRPEPLHAVSLGLLGPGAGARRLRRILDLAGMPVRPGWPRSAGLAGGAVGVWGRSSAAARGVRLAKRSGARLVCLEDAFLRSLRPGRAGDLPLGIAIDRQGPHYDPAGPSDLETLLSRHPLDDAALIQRARTGIARMIAADISKYSDHDPGLPLPAPGYVLVVDQVCGDASVLASAGIGDPAVAADAFRDMLEAARAAHPGRRILIKTHPETARGLRPGHFGPEDAGDGVEVVSAPLSPWRLLEGAIAVHVHSSQMGFEAILAGHRPQVHGAPFYAGWGLSEDHVRPLPRRGRRLTPAQLFAAAMLLYPVWYDPCRDRLCRFEEALDQIEAEVASWRADRAGHVALGMRLWKRPALQAMFGRHRRLRFASGPATALARARKAGRGLMVWAGQEPPGLAVAATRAGCPLRRIEDGFLRSRGLGAQLVPPLSLVADDLGIYYDPGRESRLERLVAAPLPRGGAARAEALRERLVAAGLSKYNTGATVLPPLPPGRRILVPGQVEDDASIRLGAGSVRRNLDLLRVAREANPDAVILYKPHPDVEAGLRAGALAPDEAAGLCDAVLSGIAMAPLLEAVDEVWTITSLTGFEALLRGKRVTCLGAPFYAGWGLTRDLGPVPDRRRARPELAALIHAALIAYPSYRDPVSGLPCPPEVAAERLASGIGLPRPPALRVLARLQGLLAGHSWIWR